MGRRGLVNARAPRRFGSASAHPCRPDHGSWASALTMAWHSKNDCKPRGARRPATHAKSRTTLDQRHPIGQAQNQHGPGGNAKTRQKGQTRPKPRLSATRNALPAYEAAPWSPAPANPSPIARPFLFEHSSTIPGLSTTTPNQYPTCISHPQQQIDCATAS